MTIKTLNVFCLVCLTLLTACAGRDHQLDTFYANHPRSIVVAPILNETLELTASPVLVSSITQPLAERGYYVFPVYLTEQLFKDLGLSEAGHIHQLPPKRFFELFGADAVLLVSIKNWSTKYLVLASIVQVEIDYKLIETQKNIVLWEHNQYVEESSGGGDPIGMIISATINALITDYLPLARQANYRAFIPPHGIPAGPYHPKFKKDQDNF